MASDAARRRRRAAYGEGHGRAPRVGTSTVRGRRDDRVAPWLTRDTRTRSGSRRSRRSRAWPRSSRPPAPSSPRCAAQAEQWGEKEARIRTARDRAVKSADELSAALAGRLRIDAAGDAGGRKGVSLFKDRQQPVTKEEAAQVELIRGSALFDDAWYLRTYHDVAHLGEDPALHFLRHPYNPFRRPSDDFDIGQYVIDHPEVLEDEGQPARALPAVPGVRGRGRLPAPAPMTTDRPPSEQPPRGRRRLPAPLVALRPAVARRRPPGPERPPRSSSRPSPRGCRRSRRRPAAAAAAGAGRRAPRRRGRQRLPRRRRVRRPAPAAAPPGPGAPLRRDRLAHPARAQPALRPLALLGHAPRPHRRGGRPAAALPARRSARRARAAAPRRHRPAPPRRTHRDRPCGAPASSRATTPTGSSTTTSWTTSPSWPATPTSSTWRTGCSSPASWTGSTASSRTRGASRTAPTTSAPSRCWRATSSAGTRLDGYDEVHPGQRLVLPAAPARRGLRGDGRPRLRLVEPPGHLDGARRVLRRRRRPDPAGRGQGALPRPAALDRRALPAPVAPTSWPSGVPCSTTPASGGGWTTSPRRATRCW